MKQNHQHEKHAKRNMKKNIYKHLFVSWSIAFRFTRNRWYTTPFRPCVLGIPHRPHPPSNQYPCNVLEVGSPRGEGQGNSWDPFFFTGLWTIIVPLIIIRPYFLSRGGCLFTPVNLNDLTDWWNWWNISVSYVFLMFEGSTGILKGSLGVGACCQMIDDNMRYLP